MSPQNEATLFATRQNKSRQSITHMPFTEPMDKENMTADIGALEGATKRAALGERPSKKLRSKSIGPGGLDALKDGTKIRRKSIAAPPARSILKPTMPLREIPAHMATRKQSPKKITITQPFSRPGDSSGLNPVQVPSWDASASVSRMVELPNPFTSDTNVAIAETRVLLRTEEEQQTAARVREAKEALEMEADINKRREARRKSLANRRVSFAPEATLHTWDVVEYLQDSTTSSASTNSTRRASSASTGTINSPHPQTSGLMSSDPPEPPSTPPEQIEDTIVASPAHQRDLHQKKRRRSSGIPPLNFNNPDDELFSSSPSSDSSVAGDENDNQVPSNGDIDDTSGSDSDLDDEGTAMSLDVADNTDMSIKSSSSSNGSTARLEEALQLAARQAGTQGIEFDEHGGLGIMKQEEEVAASFQPWSKKSATQNLISSNDQENLNPFLQAFKAGPYKYAEKEEANDGTSIYPTQAAGRIIPAQQSDDNDNLAIETTMAIGSIMSTQQANSTSTGRKSGVVGRRQSTRRRSAAEGSSFSDDTMDLTIAIGSIQQGVCESDAMNDGENEDITMEFTSVMGGVLAPALRQKRHSMSCSKPAQNRKRQSMMSVTGDDTMDMTVAFGGILPTASSSTTLDDNATVGMEMTMALGGILPKQLSTGNSRARRAIEEEAHSSSPFQATPTTSQGKAQANTVASETGSPSLAAFKGKGLRRSTGPRLSTTPKSSKTTNIETPTKKPSTPEKQFTPKISRPITPSKITPIKNVLQSIASPRGSFKETVEAKSSTPDSKLSKSTPSRLFQRDITTGATVPNIILTPQKRQSSGLGIDRTGLGSPRVADILDRRQSIGDMALAFTTGESREIKHAVCFDDLRVIENDLDKERQEEMDREDGRKFMEREADTPETGKDATLNLKEMIESLTPRKRPLKGRKSLHVGAAKGILGKRPAELDQDDDESDEDRDGIKRLKNHQGSPVKSVKLQAPPSKAETAGRITRATRRSLEITGGNVVTPTIPASPSKVATITTPKGQGRFRVADSQLSAQQVVPFVQKLPIENSVLNKEEDEAERMHLQDFLNMTSIRFMDLTTTKRRHTAAPNNTQNGISLTDNSEEVDQSFESCVVAGACTVPMLELFQHSCRELKKYISEGRNIVREIEKDTYEDNPPLFREYVTAASDIRVLMDNQFKNVKTYARLLSKAMWYEWRMKLLDGLKAGLYKISEGMDADSEILHHQQELLDSILPPLVEKHGNLTEEESDLQAVAKELASCDREELDDARQRLISVGTDVEAKRRIIRDLKKQLKDKEMAFAAATDRKQVCLDDIHAAEKIREACRGWSANEGLAFKARVDSLEKQHGWAITGISGNQVSMTFRREIELVFDASSFKSNHTTPRLEQANSTIDLWYIAGNRELNPLRLTTEKDFFLQNIRDYCRCLPQSTTNISKLLNAVSASWVLALRIANDIRTLNHDCPTEITKTSDTSIVVRSSLLLRTLATSVKLEFHVHLSNGQHSIKVEVKPHCTVTYGERFNEAKMSEFLVCRITENEHRKSWADIVAELEVRLLARGRKQ